LKKVTGKVKIGVRKLGVLSSKRLKLLWMPLGKHRMLLLLAWKQPKVNWQLFSRVLRNLGLKVVLMLQPLKIFRH